MISHLSEKGDVPEGRNRIWKVRLLICLAVCMASSPELDAIFSGEMFQDPVIYDRGSGLEEEGTLRGGSSFDPEYLQCASKDSASDL